MIKKKKKMSADINVFKSDKNVPNRDKYRFNNRLKF